VIGSPCKNCRGRGLERKTLHKVVSIPAGVDNGTQIRLGGEGQPGINGGPKGNLYLEVRVKPHKFFKRRNDDVMVDVNINITQAALGAEVVLPTVDGETKLQVPSGTQPGKVFTLKGKGIPHVRGGGRGDQLVIVNVEIPSHLNKEQKKLLEELGQTLGTEVKPQERGFFETIKDVLGG
jgi:molecular chaperone DnaJ